MTSQPHNRLPDRPNETATTLPPENHEDSRLDDALQRADDLLARSLQRDEGQRRRKRIRAIALICLGATIMTTIAVIALSALLQTAPPASVTNRDLDKASSLNQEGWVLWKDGKFDAAEAKFAEAVKIDPSYSVAWNGLGWSHFNTGESAEAEEAFLKAVETDETNAAALNGLGQLYYQQNKLDKSEEYLLKAAPNAPAAWWGLARLYLIQGKYDEAQKYAQKVADAGDSSIEPLLTAAKNKKIPDALRQQIAPPPAEAQVADAVQLGWKLFNQGRAAQAKPIFEEHLKKNPEDANALNGLGWVLLVTNKPADAQKEFEHALKVDPRAAGAMNGLARALYAQDKKDDAIKVWEDMVKNVPGVHAGTYGLADAYLAKKKYADAAKLYEQIAQQNPNDAEIKKKLDEARKGAESS